MHAKNELKYGLRYLVRDTLQSERRVQTLLAQERLPRERLDRVTNQLLMDTLMAAIRRIPRYRHVKVDFDAGNVRQALVERFPVIGRSDLNERPADHYPHGNKPRPWTIVGRTSGTSGTPLQVFRSLESVLWENAIVERHFRWSGYRPGMRRAYLRGDLVVPIEQTTPPYWFFNRYNNQQISIDDPRIGALPISGTFDAHDVATFVAFLDSLPDVRTEVSGGRIRVVAMTASQQRK